MTVQDICQRVRRCFDEEAQNGTILSGASGNDRTLMNNIIKDKVGDALRWVCLYAPAEQLSGGGSSEEGSIDIVVDESGTLPSDGRIKLGGNFIRLVRVRCEEWHRAITGDTLLEEDSDEYLQLMDPYCAEATNDRPQAALIATAEKQVEVWPHSSGKKYELTKLVMPSSTDLGSLSDESVVSIPPLLEASFIYYLAFLTLSAYGDGRSGRMLEIARMSLGQTEDKQRA